MILYSAFAAIIPILIYLSFIWLADRYDREPVKLLLVNFLWGAFGAIFFAIIGSLALAYGFSFFVKDPERAKLFETVLIAPFVEEITKGIFLVITAFNRKFDNVTDGLVFGGAIGLGFGMTENFFYFVSFAGGNSEFATLVFIRTVFSAVMHCIATASFGAFLGYAKFDRTYARYILPFIGILTAMLIHFIWNITISYRATSGIGIYFMIAAISVFISVFIAALAYERKIIYLELAEELNFIPLEHLPILSSGRRNKHGWVDERIRKEYIIAATSLAFRKAQFKKTIGYEREYYMREIEKYRTRIKGLFESVNPVI